MQRILVLSVIFLDFIGLGLVYPMFSSLLFHTESSFVDPELSQATRGLFLGLLLSTPAVMTFFSGPILGALSDQKGRKPIYILSVSTAIVGYCLCVVSIWLQSLLALFIARAIVGISMGNSAVVNATMVDLSNGLNKTKNFGLSFMANGMGIATGSFLSSWLSTFGFIAPFFGAGIAALANLILMCYLFRETNSTKTFIPINWKTGFRNLKKAFQMREMRTLFFAVAFFCFGWSTFYEFLPVIWITDYGCSLQDIGLFYAFASVIFAISSGLLIQPIVRRFSPFKVFFCSLLAMVCFMIFPFLHPSEGWIWVYIGGTNFLLALVFPAYTTIVSDSADKNSQGEILGILESIQATAYGISPLIAGCILGIHLYMPTTVGVIFLVLAALLLLQGRKEKGDMIESWAPFKTR